MDCGNVVVLKKSFETEDTVYTVKFVVDKKKKKILEASAFIRHYPLARHGFGNYIQDFFVINMATRGRYAKIEYEHVHEGWNGTGANDKECSIDKVEVKEFLNKVFKVFVQAPDESPEIKKIANVISEYVTKSIIKKEGYYVET